MKALIVDDSAVIRCCLRSVLKSIQIEVAEAKDGLEALRLLQDGLFPDVIMLDWQMPQMDGDEVLSVIRADRRFDAVRVMMVTTECDLALIAKALQDGADEYVMKPFNPEIIVDKLRILHLDPPGSLPVEIG